MRKIEIDFDSIVEIFNNRGKEAAKEYVEDTYHCSYPNIQRRIKEEGNYRFNRKMRKYEPIDESEVEFMTLEELYKEEVETIEISNEDSRLGYNCLHNNAFIYDYDGHGNFISRIMSEEYNNDYGIKGLAGSSNRKEGN